MDAVDVHNGSVNPSQITESANQPTIAECAASKPVNPLRLARPLEKTAPGLSKTAIPPTRPMPMPTISPLCPPGSNQGKNGIKSASPKNGNIASLSVPASQPLKANIPQEIIVTGDAPVEEPSPKPIRNMEAKQKLVPPKKSMSPIPSNAAPPKVSPVHEKDMVTPKAISDGAADKSARQKKRKKEPETEAVPEDERRGSKRARAPPTVYESPDPEMAQILKTIKKQEEEEKRTAGKPAVNDEEDGKKIENMTEKNAEKGEEEKEEQEESGETEESGENGGNEELEEEEEKAEKIEKIEKKKAPAVKRKRKKIVARGDSDEEEEEESEEEDDDDYKPSEPKPKSPKTPKAPKAAKPPKSTTPKKRGRKPKSDDADASTKKKVKRDPVFFKDEYLAVRNDEGTFFICKAMQNIYLGSRNITIQWLSNEDPLVPAKDNPDGDIFAHDFYDKTEFETILTSVELDKVLGRSKRMILPGEELARINKILQRAHDKAEGKLDLSNLELTEDNPDGLDISLYKGEDQLDEIDRRRTGGIKEEEEVKEVKPKKVKAVKKVEKQAKEEKKPTQEEKEEINSDPAIEETKIEEAKTEEITSEEAEVAESDSVEAATEGDIEKVESEAKPEVKKKPKGRPKKEAVTSETAKVDKVENDVTAEKENGDVEAPEIRKRGERKVAKNICYDQFDFLEDEDDEVMPVPKKRKSQDSMNAPDEGKEEVKGDEDEKTEHLGEKPLEELSTTERAILAEKARMEAEATTNAEPPTSDNQQPVKKRGRKPKPKE